MGRRLEAELVMPPERTPVSRAKAPVRTPLAWVLLPSFLAALPVLLAIFGGPEVKQTRWDAWGVLVWFALLVAAEALPVAMLRGATMTIASILDVGAILLFGPWIAGFLDLCTTGVAQVLLLRRPVGEAALNAGLYASTTILAGAAYLAAGGGLGAPSFPRYKDYAERGRHFAKVAGFDPKSSSMIPGLGVS